MAYRFKHRETVPENVKRIAAEELDSAIALLKRKRGVTREDSAYGVRKSIKKTRALLRMVRPELGDFFQEENVRLRDAGHKLSDLRDSSALIDTLNNLHHAPKPLILAVRRHLEVRKRQLLEEAAAQNLFPDLAKELRKTRISIGHWPLKTDGFEAIASGMERTFRDGKKAFAVVRDSTRTEDYHEWRKRVKDHWYHVRLLDKVWGDVMSGYRQSLKELESALGEDLNLSLLEQLTPKDAGRLARASLRKAVGSARRDLRERALEIGEKIYAAKPRDFTRQLKKLWKVW